MNKKRLLKYLPLIIPLTLIVFFMARVAEANPLTPPYLVEEQPVFTLKFTPGERTLEIFMTGRPLVRLKPSAVTVTALQKFSEGQVETNLSSSGDKFIVPNEFYGKVIELKIHAPGKVKEKFLLEVLPKD